MVENFVLSNEEEAVKKLFDERDVTRKFRALLFELAEFGKRSVALLLSLTGHLDGNSIFIVMPLQSWTSVEKEK